MPSQRSEVKFKKRGGRGLKVIDRQELKVKGQRSRLKVSAPEIYQIFSF